MRETERIVSERGKFWRMRVYDVIDAKKNRRALTAEEIRFFVARVADGSATDSQIAAFCMATLLNGMTDEECFLLTDAMAARGERAPRPKGAGVFADKHSTGGVSDSTTLILVPVLASLGVKCAKYSGRGLAHTGGTLDKLESFAGVRVDLTPAQFEAQVERVGAAVSGQTDATVPADKRMYAVRDVTATVDSIPLIASSVMSKKLASFADVILLDVKYGDGAFMKTPEEAEKLARLMTAIGGRAGRRMLAAVTCMDAPLGDAVGCNAEVNEVLEILRGEKENDLSRLSLFHAEKLLQAAEGVSAAEAEARVRESVRSGRALDKLGEIVAAQGGRAEDVYKTLPMAKNKRTVFARKSGRLQVFALALGRACAALGGGRTHEGGGIDHAAGILLKKRQGDYVKEGEPLAEIYSSADVEEGAALAESAFGISEKKIKDRPLVYAFIGGKEQSSV